MVLVPTTTRRFHESVTLATMTAAVTVPATAVKSQSSAPAQTATLVALRATEKAAETAKTPARFATEEAAKTAVIAMIAMTIVAMSAITIVAMIAMIAMTVSAMTVSAVTMTKTTASTSQRNRSLGDQRETPQELHTKESRARDRETKTLMNVIVSQITAVIPGKEDDFRLYDH
jgi:hypothetical protein